MYSPQKQTLELGNSPEADPLGQSAAAVEAGADAVQSITGEAYQPPEIGQEGQEATYLNKIQSFALSAIANYAALKGNLKTLKNPDGSSKLGLATDAAFTAAAVYGSVKAGHDTSAINPHGAHGGMNVDPMVGAVFLKPAAWLKTRWTTEERLDLVEEKLDEKKDKLEEDVEINAGIVKAISTGKAYKPSHVPVKASQIDVSRRTDKRVSKIRKRQLKIDNLQNIWGRKVGWETEKDADGKIWVKGGMAGVPNRPGVPDPADEPGKNLPGHNVRRGVGAQHSKSEKPNIYNHMGKDMYGNPTRGGSRRGYDMDAQVLDLGVVPHKTRMRSERFTPEERRIQWRAGKTIRFLKWRNKRLEKKIDNDSTGKNPLIKIRNANIARLERKQERLEKSHARLEILKPHKQNYKAQRKIERKQTRALVKDFVSNYVSAASSTVRLSNKEAQQDWANTLSIVSENRMVKARENLKQANPDRKAHGLSKGLTEKAIKVYSSEVVRTTDKTNSRRKKSEEIFTKMRQQEDQRDDARQELGQHRKTVQARRALYKSGRKNLKVSR